MNDPRLQEALAAQVEAARLGVDAIARLLTGPNRDAMLPVVMATLAQIGASLDTVIHFWAGPENPPSCTHERRIEMSSLGGPEEWQCADCGFHYTESTTND